MEQDWNAMLHACQHGEAGAGEQLFSALRVRLLTIAQYRLRGTSAGLLEDLVQATLTLVFERISTVESNPHLYALEILRHKVGDYLRTRRRRKEQAISATGYSESETDGGVPDLDLADPESGVTEARLETAEAIQVIWRAIRKLSPICQALFVGLLEGRTINDVWELAMQAEPRLSRSTFDKRLFDCRRRLRGLVGNKI